MSSVLRQRKLTPLIIFLCVLFASGCSRTPAGHIEQVLNDCVRIGNAAAALHRDPATTAGYIADHFQALDTSGCPPNFRAAFQQHVNAWRQAQFAFANNSFGNSVLEGFVAGVTENPFLIGTTSGAASQAQQNINATYYRLATIAATDGARVPRPTIQ